MQHSPAHSNQPTATATTWAETDDTRDWGPHGHPQLVAPWVLRLMVEMRTAGTAREREREMGEQGGEAGRENNRTRTRRQGRRRAVNKAKVLDLTRERILELLRQRAEVRAEKKALMNGWKG
ncbi:hypothetical protein VTK26DRAFT_2075 [Humicola hyalothermophila]